MECICEKERNVNRKFCYLCGKLLLEEEDHEESPTEECEISALEPEISADAFVAAAGENERASDGYYELEESGAKEFERGGRHAGLSRAWFWPIVAIILVGRVFALKMGGDYVLTEQSETWITLIVEFGTVVALFVACLMRARSAVRNTWWAAISVAGVVCFFVGEFYFNGLLGQINPLLPVLWLLPIVILACLPGRTES